jgi:hypothetical protein
LSKGKKFKNTRWLVPTWYWVSGPAEQLHLETFCETGGTEPSTQQYPTTVQKESLVNNKKQNKDAFHWGKFLPYQDVPGKMHDRMCRPCQKGLP